MPRAVDGALFATRLLVAIALSFCILPEAPLRKSRLVHLYPGESQQHQKSLARLDLRCSKIVPTYHHFHNLL